MTMFSIFLLSTLAASSMALPFRSGVNEQGINGRKLEHHAWDKYPGGDRDAWEPCYEYDPNVLYTDSSGAKVFQMESIDENCDTAPFCVGAVLTNKGNLYFDEHLTYKAGKTTGYCTVVGIHNHVPTFYCAFSIFWDYETKCDKRPTLMVAEAAFSGTGLLDGTSVIAGTSLGTALSGFITTEYEHITVTALAAGEDGTLTKFVIGDEPPPSGKMTPKKYSNGGDEKPKAGAGTGAGSNGGFNGIPALQNICESIDGDNINNATTPLWAQLIIDQQPDCVKTCDEFSDAYYKDLSGLQDSPDNELNTLALDEVASAEQLARLISTMGPLKVATEKQRHCILTPEIHLDELNGPNPDIYYASVNINASVLQFAPPRGEENACDRQLGSMGLYYNADKDEIQAICSPDSPGRQWNDFAANGSLTKLYETCGYEFQQDYWKDITQPPGCYAVLSGGPCQKNFSQSGGNSDSCYCVFEEAVGLHCPLFAPVYYVNNRIVWQLGGLDFLGRMPGSRVFCDKADVDNKCRDMCETSVLTLNDFPACRGSDYHRKLSYVEI